MTKTPFTREQIEEQINRPRKAGLRNLDDWRDAVALGQSALHYRALRLPRKVTEARSIPTARQVDRMIVALPVKWSLPVRVLAATGARVSELELWTWGDVDIHESRILNQQGKTPRARRWVAVPANLITELASTVPLEDRTAERRLFPGYSGDGARTAIARACRDAGVAHLTPHDLRHRYVSVQLARGVPVANVGAQVGHARLSETLDTYTHVVVEDE